MELSKEWRDVHSANEFHESGERLDAQRDALRIDLQRRQTETLREIERTLNAEMLSIVERVFGGGRKSPEISLSANAYSFEVFEDTGTGAAYTGLIVFDLAMYALTSLPVLIHDSLLFKNIENQAVAKLVPLYDRAGKQSFISIDEIEKYGPSAARFLISKARLLLSDSEVLYVKDWRAT